MAVDFLHTLIHYVIEVVPSVALGLFLSGVIHEFVPQSLVDRHLVKKGFLSLLYVTLAGIFLPLCCFGSLPVAVGLRKKGVPLGPVLAFLVATPATSLTAILVAWKLMGPWFTLYLCLSVVVIALLVGLIGNILPGSSAGGAGADSCPMCEEGEHTGHRHHGRAVKDRIISVFSFGFIDIPKEIGLELVIGVVLAAALASVSFLGTLVKRYLVGGYGYLFALVFGIVMYICSTASVPLVHAFLEQGLGAGAGMVLLLVGPITSWGTILVVRKEFGDRVLLVYLVAICVLSLLAGYLYQSLPVRP